MSDPSHNEIVESLKQVYDPEISLNIYDLGLIYDINIKNNSVKVLMSLTSPMCPAADQIISDVYQQLYRYDFESIDVDITFDPPWDMSMISDEGQLALGMFYDPPS